MALHKLTPTKIAGLTKRGKYSDGAGLWLQVSSTGNKYWVFRWERNGGGGIRGTQRHMSFGPAHTISLTTARELARQAREKLLMGIDPLDERRQVRAEAARRFTFKEAADAYIKMHAPEWSAKTEREWQLSLETHAASILSMDVERSPLRTFSKSWTRSATNLGDTYQPLIGQRVKSSVSDGS